MVVARCLGALEGEMWTLKAAGIILDKSSVWFVIRSTSFFVLFRMESDEPFLTSSP